MDSIKDFKFNKKFGQNFIFDTNLLSAIVKDSGVSLQDDVLEIGPGAGTLTKIIAENCKKVVSYEIDTSLKPILEDNLQGVHNSQIIFADALKTDIKEIENSFLGNYKIIANLPYYITTPLIFKFIEQTKRIDSLTVMVQKEVGDRFVAKPNSKDYGIITVMLDFYGNVKVVRQVNRKMFTPSPNVDSCVVKIDIVKNKYNCDESMFSKIVHSSFAMRRKTLVNNLSSGLNVSKQQVIDLLKSLNINENIRAENLTTQDFVKITLAYLDKVRQ